MQPSDVLHQLEWHSPLSLLPPAPPSLSPASANICNVVLMRYGELEEGIDVLDGDGNLVGSSKIAARHVGHLGGLGHQWGGQRLGEGFIPLGLLCVLCLLDPSCLPSASALGLQVWPLPRLSPHGPSSPSIIATARHPISCPSPSGPGFSDLLIGKGRGDALELSFPHPGTQGAIPWAFMSSRARREGIDVGGSPFWATRVFCGCCLTRDLVWLRRGSGEEQLTAGRPSPISHFTGLTHSANCNLFRKF